MPELSISTSPRDALVNIISQAIKTGGRVGSGKSVQTNAFYAGGIEGRVSAAATLVATMYNGDYVDVKMVIMREVEAAHLQWPTADLWDAAKTGAEGDRIATKVIDSL